MPDLSTHAPDRSMNGVHTSATSKVPELPREQLAEVRVGFDDSIFGELAPLLLANGLSPLPIEPGAKRPLGALSDWSRLRSTPLTLEDIAAISERFPNAGIGVVGGFGGLVPLDIDTDDDRIIEAIMAALPTPLVGKRGRRGMTLFFRSTETITARKFRQTDGVPMVEVLITGQTVIPPTLHPETGLHYQWLSDDVTLLTCRVEELPEITLKHMAALETALTPWTVSRPEYVPRQASRTEPASPTRMRAYAEVALKAEAKKLRAMAKDSGRNRALFDAGCKLGRYLHHGVLSKAELVGALLDACHANGLLAEDGLQACERSLRSGLRKAQGDNLPVIEDRLHSAERIRLNGGTRSPDAGGEPPASGPNDGRKRSQANHLIEIASRDGVELFHTPDGTAYADVVIDGHRETWPLKSVGFQRWLRRAYYLETGDAPNREATSTAMSVIEARAQFDGAERSVHLRVAEYGDHIYLDLCDDRWRVIEIDPCGWRIVEAPPVRFRRTAGMLPLPEPVRGGTVAELREHMHVDDGAYVLAVSWLVAIMRGRGPYPILALTGEQGTGKSLTANQLRSLVDPHSAPLRSLPRDTRDLYVTAINGHVLVFDNLSSISAEISDALCRLSTGGGFSTRALYTNDEEVIFDGQRPIALTSITDVASRSDLADRLLLVRLEVIPDAKRRTEAELHAAFDAARPRILGALLDVVAHGLMQLPHTRLNHLPRMADYATWVRACETAIWSAGMHMAAYEVNRADAVDVVLDADPIAIALRQHMEGRTEHVTTATELLNALSPLASDQVRRGRQWPGNGRALSGQLTRLGPALRRVGITVEPYREAHTGRRLLHIRNGGAPCL